MGLRQEAGVDKVLPVEAGGEGLGVELVLGVGGQVGEQHLCGGGYQGRNGVRHTFSVLGLSTGGTSTVRVSQVDCPRAR